MGNTCSEQVSTSSKSAPEKRRRPDRSQLRSSIVSTVRPLVPASHTICLSTQRALVPVHYQGFASAPLTVPSLQGSTYAGSATSRTKERLQCFCEGAAAEALRQVPSRVVASASFCCIARQCSDTWAPDMWNSLLKANVMPREA